jgi:hypothetical protein
MSDQNLPPSIRTESFVVRLWEETPGEWRGSIRHVQSETRRGFTRLNQVVRFIEQQTGQREERRAVPSSRPRFDFGLQMNRRSLTMLALAGGILAIVLVLVLSISGVRVEALTAFMGR